MIAFIIMKKQYKVNEVMKTALAIEPLFLAYSFFMVSVTGEL